MKLISNRIRASQNDPDRSQRADVSDQLVGRPQPSPAAAGEMQGLSKEESETRTFERERGEPKDRAKGNDVPEREGVLGRTTPSANAFIAPNEETATSSSSSSSDTLPPEANPVPLSPEPGTHHEVTWLMLRLLAAHGKVKAADGSDILVTFIGEEPPLGDVFQIEAISPDMEQRNMTVVVLANETSIEVLGGQEVVVIDSAPFQIHRQPITTTQDVAEAMFDLVEIELRRMGQILLEAVRDVWQNDEGQEQSE